MNWIAFFVLSYAAVALQSGLTPFLRYGAAEPNLVILALVFIAINAERHAALLGCYILGAMHDLATRQPFGLFAFSYGLAAWAVISAARSVYREHPLTHFSCALVAGAITAAVLLVHEHLRRDGVTAVGTFAGAIYTAMLAPVVIGPLMMTRDVFGFKRKGLRTQD
jgi:rod shape-determining protein MreD